MLTRLKLENFKNFKKAELHLGELTLLVGTNASGKSNLRDAFRFLHGVSRGYSLADIIGGKYGDGGYLEWRGIRGGTREIAMSGMAIFGIEAAFEGELNYRIHVAVADSLAPRVFAERLQIGRKTVFDTHPANAPRLPYAAGFLFAHIPRNDESGQNVPVSFSTSQSMLAQVIANTDPELTRAKDCAVHVRNMLSSMRFFDLAPDSMRKPSLPGQVVLGDHGENLSSVLQAICAEESSKRAILDWIKELTPLDVTDFEFVPDQTGKILVSLIEAGGQKTSAYSASDGTLRFLAMISALLGPSPARFYFFEELENGIHPTRLYLLLQLIEQRVAGGQIQMVATSHSPQLLGFLSEKAREAAALVYRRKDRTDVEIARIMDIPEAQKVLQKQNLSRLHESGWLEDAVSFLPGDQNTAAAEKTA
jgi:predicted ATPase